MVRRHETLDGWVITDAATAVAVLRAPELWSSDRFDGPRRAEYAAWVQELMATEDGVRELLEVTPQALVGLDPPQHTRMRSVLRRSFAPAVIEGLRPVVAEEVAAALGTIVTGEPVDVVTAFTRPVPFRVVARLLGLPRAAWAELEALAHAASTDDTATEDFAGLRARLLAERDIMRLFLAHLDGPVESEQILPVLRAAVVEQAITPREAPACAARCSSPARTPSGTCSRARCWRSLCMACPRSWSAFVEERLALEPPFAAFWRRATRDTVLDGLAIPADGLVELPYARLNEHAARHLSFGHGIHFCLGAALARLEAQVALRAVLDATSRIEVAGAVERLASPSVNGYRRLVLRLTT